MMLGDGRKPLVEDELEVVVVGLDNKSAPPEVWPPMLYCLDQPDKLPLVSCQGGVSRSDCLTEVSDWPLPWWSIAPNPEPDASQSNMNNMVKSESCKTGAVVRAVFRASKVRPMSSDHRKTSFRSAVSGAAMTRQSWMNFR